MRLKAPVIALAVAVTALPASALAQSGSWNFSVGAATDNQSKDISKSDGKPFVWGEAQWENDNGFFYAGPAFETIRSGGSDLELELGGGIRPQWAGFDFDLNATHKWRIGADAGHDDDAWEFTADMKRAIGPASARLRVQHSPDGTGATKAWTWVSAKAGWDFNDRLSASAEVGHRDQQNAIDYTGYNVGISYMLTDALELNVRWHGNDADIDTEQYKDRLVAGIAYAF